MLATCVSKKQLDPDALQDVKPTGKEVQVDWSLNLGEHGVAILVARLSPSLAASQSDIVIIGKIVHSHL